MGTCNYYLAIRTFERISRRILQWFLIAQLTANNVIETFTWWAKWRALVLRGWCQSANVWWALIHKCAHQVNFYFKQLDFSSVCLSDCLCMLSMLITFVKCFKAENCILQILRLNNMYTALFPAKVNCARKQSILNTIASSN